jgi:SAM-dependent methyltransferase
MRPKSWDNLAPSYEDEVFNVLAHDREGHIVARVRRFGGAREVASDLGCGIGGFLPLLAENFGKVHAIDGSRRLLARARERCAALGNVEFLHANLSARRGAWPVADFALCVNVLLTPMLSKREAMMRRLRFAIQPEGRLLLVVPSLESVLLTHRRRIQWGVRDGLSPARAAVHGRRREETERPTDLARGIVVIDGARTKHYLREELADLLAEHGLEAEEVIKIEYPWETEFAEPPQWMQAPYPWDWLALARRVR